MSNIVDLIEQEIKSLIKKYKDNSEDHYDFWNEHIKYVYEESQILAKQYGADIEVVKLGALLHDIALFSKVGDRKDHHINGRILAEKILKKYDYPEDKLNRVLSTVYNHRSSKNSTNIEDLCVADADIIAHFDNIPMLFNSAYNRCNINLNEVRTWMKDCFEKDYNDLSNRTKEQFREKYKLICRIVIGEDNFSCSRDKINIKEISNTDLLNECLEVILKTYKDRDKKMKLSNQDNHRHSNMTYEELKKRFDNGIKMYGYYNQEKIIAFLSLEFKENEIKIRDIVVLPEYQNKGIGKDLLDYAKEKTIENNKSKLILRFIYDNKKLKEWYEKYGFKVTEIFEFPGTGKVGQMEYIINN